LEPKVTVSGQSLLNIVGFSLFAAFGAVGVHLALATLEFGRAVKTVRPDLYKFWGVRPFSEYWALYFTPQQNPALERPRKRIIKSYKWAGLLLGMWLLFMLMQLIFMLTQGPPAY
jgi:hypothetical protein